MKKIFTLAIAALFSIAIHADVIFSYTLTSAGSNGAVYDAVGGTATCIKAMSPSGSKQYTIGDQTFFGFDSSSEWSFTLASGTFAIGDVISVTIACGASAKNGKGVILNDGVSLTGNVPANSTATLTYTVQENDGIAGLDHVNVKRADSDAKFGTIVVERSATTGITSATIESSNAGKAVKLFENGQLIIRCNGKSYNAQGCLIK